MEVFNFNTAPSKSALSQFRKKIKFTFFQSIFENVMSNFERQRAEFQGLRIYAVDGWQFTLPRTDSVVSAGYTGRKTSKYRESYMPKGYVSHIYDVLSETTKDTFMNYSNTELVDALGFVDKMEQNSLSLYDRAYFSKILCKTHFEKGSYFLARCQSNANAVVKKLFDNKGSNNASMYIETTKGKKKIWFLKVINKKSNVATIFATNLPSEWRTRNMLDRLYQLRWGVETSFYELSETAKMQQWHSKSFNGILQEFYTLLLIINLTKIISFYARGQKVINPLKATYAKPNFKLLFNHLTKFIISSKPQLSRLIYRFQELIKRSTERRKRRSRAHPREIRSPASPYPYNNTEWDWDKGYSLN